MHAYIHTYMHASHRLGRRELARGWVAWMEVHQEKVMREKMLRGVAGRLTRPKLVASYAHWRSDWEALQVVRLIRF